MGHAIFERVRLFGTRSADYIRASGHNGCIATEVTLQATTEAEYMTAPARFADSQIPLAPRAPSIHDPFAKVVDGESAIGCRLTGEAQSQDGHVPDGSPWPQLPRIAAAEPLLLTLSLRGRLYALP